MISVSTLWSSPPAVQNAERYLSIHASQPGINARAHTWGQAEILNTPDRNGSIHDWGK